MRATCAYVRLVVVTFHYPAHNAHAPTTREYITGTPVSFFYYCKLYRAKQPLCHYDGSGVYTVQRLLSPRLATELASYAQVRTIAISATTLERVESTTHTSCQILLNNIVTYKLKNYLFPSVSDTAAQYSYAPVINLSHCRRQAAQLAPHTQHVLLWEYAVLYLLKWIQCNIKTIHHLAWELKLMKRKNTCHHHHHHQYLHSPPWAWA